MDFTKELNSFPSEVHKVIYLYAREMTSLDRSLADISDTKLRLSCEEYYAYLLELFSDMYQRPEAYEMPVMELENFVDGRKINGVKQKFPSKTKSIIAKTRNCADRYIQTICRMGYMGSLEGDELVLTKDDLKLIDKAVNTSTSPVSLAKRLEAFKLTGLLSKEHASDSNKLVFYSSNHPLMFQAMVSLSKKTKGVSSGFDYYLFQKADFRNILNNYHPTAEDYFYPLPKEKKEIGLNVHKFALELGCKTDISTFLKVNYKYKGAQVMLIDTKEGCLEIRITEVYSWDNQTLFNEILDKQSDEMKRCADKHLWRCTACSTSHVGQMIYFLGKRNRVCGGGLIGFLWRNPCPKAMDKIRFFLETRCHIIDEQKKAEKVGK